MENILDEGLFNALQGQEYNKKDFQFYKDFQHIEEARDFIHLLHTHKIPYLASKPEVIIDEAIVGTRLLPKVIVKIKSENFTRVNQLIKAEIETLNYEDIQDHYLNQLDDIELKAVLQQPDEWSVEDVNIAKILLRGKGFVISEEEIQQLREKRLQEIRAGKTGNRIMMALYFLSIIIGFFINAIFILAGLGMGYYYAYSKSVDLDGHQHYIFEPTTRKYGKFILFGGIAVLLVELLLLLIMA